MRPIKNLQISSDFESAGMFPTYTTHEVQAGDERPSLASFSNLQFASSEVLARSPISDNDAGELALSLIVEFPESCFRRCGAFSSCLRPNTLGLIVLDSGSGGGGGCC